MKQLVFLALLIFLVGCKAEIGIEPSIECTGRSHLDEPEYNFVISDDNVYLNYSGSIAGCAPMKISYSRSDNVLKVFEKDALNLQCRSPSRYCYRVFTINEKNIEKVELYSSNEKTAFGYKYTLLAEKDKTEQPTECTANTDCVAATCCHATECVPKDQAPNCDGVMCTMSCEPNTLDCGGSCSCEQGKCTANYAEI